MPDFDPAAAVARSRRAMRQVRGLENSTVRIMLADLREARGELLARLAVPGSDFSKASALSMFQEVDRVIGDLERELLRDLRGNLTVAGDLGVETVARAAEASGIQPFKVRPLVFTPALVAAQTEAAMDEVTGITNAAKTGLRLELRRAMAGGLSMQEFTRRVGKALPGPGPFGTVARRAEIVARNEVLNVFQFGKDAQQEKFREQGIEYEKTWVTSRDARVRPSHLVLDGTTLPMEEDFDVGGFPAARPRDPRLPASEAIGCRCDLALRFVEKTLDTARGAPTISGVGVTVS